MGPHTFAPSVLVPKVLFTTSPLAHPKWTSMLSFRVAPWGHGPCQKVAGCSRTSPWPLYISVQCQSPHAIITVLTCLSLSLLPSFHTHKPFVGWGCDLFVYPQHFAQCLACSRDLINECGVWFAQPVEWETSQARTVCWVGAGWELGRRAVSPRSRPVAHRCTADTCLLPR